MRRKIYALVATIALLVTFVAACAGSGGTGTAGTRAAIRLGALLPTTGDNASSGARAIDAFRLAVRQANDSGGVLGRRVELTTADDACDPQTAVDQANAMVRKKITISVGGYCSSATVPTLQIFHDAGIPMIIPAANSTDLIAPGYDSVFLLAGTTAMEAQRAVRWMPQLGVHRVAVVHDGTSYSETTAQATREAAGQPGSGIVVVRQTQLSQGAPDYGRMAQQIIQLGPDLVFYTGYYPEAGKLIRDLRVAGYAGKIMVSDGGMDPGLFRDATPAQVEGVYGISPPVPQYTTGAEQWSAQYRKLTGQDPIPFTMQAYDAVRLALNAIKRAGTTDRASVRKALLATSPKDVKLLSGPANFSPHGVQPDARFILLRVHHGRFVLQRAFGG